MPAEPFQGELALYPYNFVPSNWALCDGRLLPIYQNTALYALLGTTYGGDGKTTFALPDLRGRSPVGYGQGQGLSQIEWGEQGGSVNVTLNASQMPTHTHALACASAGDSNSPAGKVLAVASDPNGESVTLYAAPSRMSMYPTTVQFTGSNTPFNNRSPYLGLEWCIALQGVFPPRQ